MADLTTTQTASGPALFPNQRIDIIKGLQSDPDELSNNVGTCLRGEEARLILQRAANDANSPAGASIVVSVCTDFGTRNQISRHFYLSAAGDVLKSELDSPVPPGVTVSMKPSVSELALDEALRNSALGQCRLPAVPKN